MHFSYLCRAIWTKLTIVILVILATYAYGALTPIAEQLIGNSEQVLRTLSNPVPRTLMDLRSEDGHHLEGLPTVNVLLGKQAEWDLAVARLGQTPLLRTAVHIETALQHFGDSRTIRRAVAAHLENRQRIFYHLGGNVYLTKVGPETQQAYTFFTRRTAYTGSGANSAILVWRKDHGLQTDPQLILSAAMYSPASVNPLSWTPHPMLQLGALDQFVLVPGPRSRELYRFDETQQHRVFVPRESLTL